MGGIHFRVPILLCYVSHRRFHCRLLSSSTTGIQTPILQSYQLCNVTKKKRMNTTRPNSPFSFVTLPSFFYGGMRRFAIASDARCCCICILTYIASSIHPPPCIRKNQVSNGHESIETGHDDVKCGKYNSRIEYSRSVYMFLFIYNN